jgi:hypothetical protein
MKIITLKEIEDRMTVNYCGHLCKVHFIGTSINLYYLGLHDNDYPILQATENLLGIKLLIDNTK